MIKYYAVLKNNCNVIKEYLFCLKLVVKNSIMYKTKVSKSLINNFAVYFLVFFSNLSNKKFKILTNEKNKNE